MRLIDANEVIKIAKENKAVIDALADIKDIEDIIDNSPTIETEPVKHGKWILTEKPATELFTYMGEISCSVCNHGTIATDKQSVNDYLEDTKYCSHCGAKMDGVIII